VNVLLTKGAVAEFSDADSLTKIPVFPLGDAMRLRCGRSSA
jgi:hypothetical protein